MRDTEVDTLIKREAQRQNDEICLIASENYTSKDVMEAQGSCLTNKYAEGYPNKRYYAGCEIVDEVEQLAIDRCKKLFNCAYANVQPHSGSQANQAVYAALLKPGDRVLAMDLNAGGHITHISKASYTSKLYIPLYYGLDNDGRINYKEIHDKLHAFNPRLLIVGASAYAREIDFRRIRTIVNEYHKAIGADESNKCYIMVDMAHIAGLVAAGYHMNPVPYADVVTFTVHKTMRGPRGGCIISDNVELGKKLNYGVFPSSQGGPLMHVIAGKAVAFGQALTQDFKEYIGNVILNVRAMVEVFNSRGIDMVSGGSDNHLILLDLKRYNKSGKEVEDKLTSFGIITNKNAVPFDRRPKTETSGLRIGTAAVTTRGFDTNDCKVLANIIADVILNTMKDPSYYTEIVKEMTKKHPLDLTNVE